MRQSLYHGGHGILSTTIFSRNFVADIHNIFPIFRSQVLVGRLGYKLNVSAFALQFARPPVCKTPHITQYQTITYRQLRQRHFAVRETFSRFALSTQAYGIPLRGRRWDYGAACRCNRIFAVRITRPRRLNYLWTNVRVLRSCSRHSSMKRMQCSAVNVSCAVLQSSRQMTRFRVAAVYLAGKTQGVPEI
jgi:hypothetical protein